MNKFKSILIGGAICLAACFGVQAQSIQDSLTVVPSTGTNASAGAITNVVGTPHIIKIQGAGPGVSTPLPCAIFASGGGVSAGNSTNTFTFANSFDGVTLCNTNTWTMTLICNSGTNIAKGYTLIGNTNYQGAVGFGLIAVTVGNTNGFTNGTLTVSWPY